MKREEQYKYNNSEKRYKHRTKVKHNIGKSTVQQERRKVQQQDKSEALSHSTKIKRHYYKT